jgi:flagellar motility protein MotE (MotC chaperone)
MTRIRLLPVLLFGLVSLLGLKVVGLIGEPSKTVRTADISRPLGERFARSATLAREGIQEDNIITGSVPKKEGEEKKDPAKPDASKPDAAKSKDGAEAGKPKINPEPEGARIIIPPQPVNIPSPAERELLEKLKARRESLETRNREVEMRDTLLRETERKLDERVNQLRALEGTSEGAGAKEEVKNRYKPLIIMYESMKPKDAARVFDKLEIKELVELVRYMNPRKMSEILAAMDPAAAVKLTVAMAREAQANPAAAVQEASAQPGQDLELPRLAAPAQRPAPAPAAPKRP